LSKPHPEAGKQLDAYCQSLIQDAPALLVDTSDQRLTANPDRDAYLFN